MQMDKMTYFSCGKYYRPTGSGLYGDDFRLDAIREDNAIVLLVGGRTNGGTDSLPQKKNTTTNQRTIRTVIYISI